MRALLTMLGTVALAAAVWFWFTRDSVAIVPPENDGGSAAVEATMAVSPPSTAAAASDQAQWERVHHQLARIAERLESLERRLTTVATALPLRTEPTSPATIDPQDLRRALDEVDAQRTRDKYAAMTDHELLAEVERLQWKNDDAIEAERALHLLLERELDADTSADARTQLGILQRQCKDMAGSQRTLQALVDERGMRDKRGGWAAYQLAWTLREGDPAAALGVADALAQQAADGGTRMRARWAAARFAEQLGDVTRARTDYEALLAACGDDAQFADVRKDVRHRLQQLDAPR